MSAGLTLDLRNYRDWAQQVSNLDRVLDSLDTTVDRIAASMNRVEHAVGSTSNQTRSAVGNFNTAASALSKVDNELKSASTQASQTAGNFRKVGDSADDMGDEVAEAAAQSGSGFGGFMNSVVAGVPAIAAAFATVVAAAAAMAVGIGVSANNAYIEWETAFAGVVKTVDGTDAELAALEDQIRAMATDKTNPVAGLDNAAVTLAGIAEQAGQLGVPIENLQQFTETMAMLQMAAPALGEQAPQQLAQFANIVQMPLTNIDRLASTIVNLGNNMATTEPAIVEFMHRLAGAGDQAGMTEAEIAGLAAAMASVGLDPEAGGSAMTTTIRSLATAVAEGGADLLDFAEISGISADQFSATWRDEPVQALMAFIQGLSQMDQAAQIQALNNLGLDGLRTADTLSRLAGNADLVSKSLDIANQGWEENNALQKEASARFDTTEAQINLAKNQFKELGYTIGEVLNPYVREALGLFNDLLGVAGSELTDLFTSMGLLSATPSQEVNAQNTLLQERADILAQIAAREAELGTGGGALDTYIVQAGDSLGRLAEQWGTTIAAIQTANPQLEGGGIQPGDEIKNPVAVEVTGDEQLVALNEELARNEQQLKLTRDEATQFGDDVAKAEEKTKPFADTIKTLQEKFALLATPIQNAAAEAINELVAELEAIPPEDIENMKTLAETVGLFMGVFVGVPLAAAGIATIGAALFALNFAANAVEPTVDILSGLGEVLQGIKNGNPEQIGNGIRRLGEGIVGLNVGAWEALGEAGISIVQFFADLAGIDVNVKDRVQAAIDGFATIEPIVQNIAARLGLGFANLKLEIVNGINDVIEGINSMVNAVQNAPSSVLTLMGLPAEFTQSEVISPIDTSGLEAGVAEQQLNFDLLVGADTATLLENAKTEGGGYSQAYIDGITEKLNDPAISTTLRSQLLTVLASAFDSEGGSLFNDLSADQLFGEGLAATLSGLNIELSTEADGALNYAQIEEQIQADLDSGAISGEGVVIAVNAKLQLQGLQGEDPTLTEGDAALLEGFDLTSILPEGAPLLDAGTQYGLDLTTGLQLGLTEGSASASEAATNTANEVSNAFTGAWQIQSPSGLTYGYGINLAEGLVMGLLAGQANVNMAIALLTGQFGQIEARSTQVAASTRSSFGSMGQTIQSLAGMVAGSTNAMIANLNALQTAANGVLAVLNQISTVAGVPMSVVGAGVAATVTAQPRADGGPVEAGQVYNVAERSTGGIELFQAPDGLYMISAQSGTIIPPQTMPQQSIYNQSSGGLVFSPQITIGANAGVTEGQVRGLFVDMLTEMQRMVEPSEMSLARAGY